MTKASLGADIMAAIGKDVPEVSGSLSQPIQMRTNELVAGIRSDVAVLIYGTDLDLLAQLGEKVATSVRSVSGVVLDETDVWAAEPPSFAFTRALNRAQSWPPRFLQWALLADTGFRLWHAVSASRSILRKRVAAAAARASTPLGDSLHGVAGGRLDLPCLGPRSGLVH